MINNLTMETYIMSPVFKQNVINVIEQLVDQDIEVTPQSINREMINQRMLGEYSYGSYIWTEIKKIIKGKM